MKEIKVLIDADLESQLERFEDVARVAFKPATELYRNVHCDTHYLQITLQLTPKPKPLPEPDWSKLWMLKSGGYLFFDINGWHYSQCHPIAGPLMWGMSNLCRFRLELEDDYYNTSVFPSIPAERWKEACWQVP